MLAKFTQLFCNDQSSAHVVYDGKRVLINNHLVECWYFDTQDKWTTGKPWLLVAKTDNFTYQFKITAGLRCFVKCDLITKEMFKVIEKNTPAELLLTGIVGLYNVFETPEE